MPSPSWSEIDNTAEEEQGKWYACYPTPSGWAYLIGRGQGYDTKIEACFASAQMHIGAPLRSPAE